MPTIPLPSEPASGSQQENNTQAGAPTVVPPVTQPVVQPATQPVPQTPPTGDTPTGTTPEAEEGTNYTDPNKIPVRIKDEGTPLVILFGPPACGKTMTLVRLTRYLLKEEKETRYKVKPDTTFRPQADVAYQNLCRDFDKMISNPNAALSTGVVDYMLIKVLTNGEPFCQILEGPGELYFDPSEPDAEYPAYLNYIINSKNRKVWVIIVEPESTSKNMTDALRDKYVEKITKLKRNIRRRDKVIILLNKIDETDYYTNQGSVKGGAAIKDVKDTYTHLFDIFKSDIPIFKWFKPYDCDFAIFQTGTFPKAADGTVTYQPGPEVYPGKLWELLKSRITG